MRSLGWGDDPEFGDKFYARNVACLDDVDIDELISAPIAYIYGRHDPPARHL